VLLAELGLRIMQFVGDQADTRLLETSIDVKTISFTVALSLIVSLVFSMAPLVNLMGRSLHDTLKSTSGAASGTVGAMRFRQIMIVSQLSLALVLLIGTGLMLRSFWKLQQVDAGFDPRSLVTASVGLSGTGGALPPIWTRIADRVTRLPGVESSALTTALPPSRAPTYMGVMIEGFVPTNQTPYQPVEFFQSVTAGYFKTFGIRLREGRLFDDRDGPQAPRVAIINTAMARTFWGNRSPLGHRLRIGLETDWRTVVGVVSDTKNDGLDKPTGTEVFLPYTQPSYIDESVPSIVIRTQEDGSSVVSELRQALKQVDATIPLVKVRTMTQVLSAALARHRFLTLLLTLFAAVALVLATVGVYGIVSYSSAQRTKEFGIRIALGAEPTAVLKLVLQRGFLLTACGIALGLLLAFWLTRLLSAFLFGITAVDTETFVVVCLVLGAIAVAASYIPARRATKIDPLAALRAE
jgi:putative ABC transport system permease protein